MHRGDIYWHALPFNGQLEFFDVSLLEFAVQLTHELDIKFGLPPKRTMSQVGSCSTYAMQLHASSHRARPHGHTHRQEEKTREEQSANDDLLQHVLLVL